MSLDQQIRERLSAGDRIGANLLRNRVDGSMPLAGLVATCTATGGNFRMRFRLHAPDADPRGQGWRERASERYQDADGVWHTIPRTSIGSTARGLFYKTAKILEDLGAIVPALDDWRAVTGLTPALPLATAQTYIRRQIQARKIGAAPVGLISVLRNQRDACCLEITRLESLRDSSPEAYFRHFDADATKMRRKLARIQRHLKGAQ